MHFSIAALFLLLQMSIAQNSNELIYLLTVTSQAIGGSTEILCVQVRQLGNPQGILSLSVTLELGQTQRVLLRQNVANQGYYRCMPFQVPDVSVDSEASIGLQLRRGITFVNKTTKILIKPRTQLVFIQTDKPIYKPGQTVKIRIVSLNTNFFIYNQKFPTIELQDPSSNRIGQWLNIPTSSGLVNLTYPTNTESPHGTYIITVWDQKNQANTQSFEISEYVLPKFEVIVTCPPVITILETSATVKVCAKYTYGKPVIGSVKTVVCRSGYNYIFTYRFAPNGGPVETCKTYSGTTDSTGCITHELNLNDFSLRSLYFYDTIRVDSEVEEQGTGVILKGSGSMTITTQIVTVRFEDSPSYYKPGINYKGKVKMTGPTLDFAKNRPLTLTVRKDGVIFAVKNLVTNNDGIAEFSLETEQWGQASITLEAKYPMPEQSGAPQGNVRTPSIPIASLTLQPFFSDSGSFIALDRPLAPFSCSNSAVIKAQYLIKLSALGPRQQTMNFFYMVMSKGTLVQYGTVSVAVKQDNRGEVSFQLQNVKLLTPVAQVVIYILLYTREAVADSMNFPIERCLPNKVSLRFMSQTELPGVNTTMELRAAPGSLCSLRAIDQSLLLLKPEKELNVQYIFDLLPVQTVRGYPYNVDDEYMNCVDSPPDGGMDIAMRRSIYIPYYSNNDVYNMFKNIGIKILTNAVVRKPVECFRPIPYLRPALPMGAPMAAPMAAPMGAPGPAIFARVAEADGREAGPPITTVRKFFPETWIWDLVAVGASGIRNIKKTVPDSITTWDADAFCTSPIGFGVAPKTNLTAFQPFFVSLTLPSSVIRGEVLTLKASVFNYLQDCILVNVVLGQSLQFKVQACSTCTYTRCLCADESFTVTWTIIPQALGLISINVTAEAVQSLSLCGNRSVAVPMKGRVDMVINKLLVLAEGTKQTKSYNELMCPLDNVMERTVSLTLPAVFVRGSVTASVSVLGDLMGRALKNLASLLAMPYGCGEQNMLLFAPNIFILLYLESSGQLTLQIRSKAETFLINGYQRELTYKHTDGSYSAFGMSDRSGNTWLTAFVMKSFGAAKHYIFIDQQYVDQARAWLGQQQQANGCFASVGLLIHTDMKGGVNDEVTLSAYITAALLELGVSTTDSVVSKSLMCLRNASSQLTTYTMALLCYTFTLSGDQTMRNILLTKLNGRVNISTDGRHWSRENVGTVDSLEVEMTSYVLLALLSGPFPPGFNMGYCASIVHWLALQQNAFGGFASTQDTVVALQALAKYSSLTYSPSGSVKVTVTSPSGLKKEFTVNQRNRLLYQESQLQKVPGNYKVKADGKGCVYVQFTVRYNIPPPADFSSFSIVANATGKCGPVRIIIVIVIIRYNGKRDKTNMVIIEVKLLSGFNMDKTSVKPVKLDPGSTTGIVKRVDLLDGSAFIYLNELKKGEEKSYTMTITQEDAVENLKPAVVKVYDYYETGDMAVAQYTSPCV